MKNHISASRTQSEPADVDDAIQALRSHEAQPIGWCLEDAGPILSKIADLLNPPAESDCKVRLQFSVPPEAAPPGTGDDDCEWLGSRCQVEEAIRARHAAPLGSYLRDLGDFLSHLAPCFAPREGSRDVRLEFVRRGRGRRVDQYKKIFSDSNALMNLTFETLASGKQEAAIEALKHRRGMSRPSIFRRKKAAKVSRK